LGFLFFQTELMLNVYDTRKNVSIPFGISALPNSYWVAINEIADKFQSPLGFLHFQTIEY